MAQHGTGEGVRGKVGGMGGMEGSGGENFMACGRGLRQEVGERGAGVRVKSVAAGGPMGVVLNANACPYGTCSLDHASEDC
jgi:hypothetical protein